MNALERAVEAVVRECLDVKGGEEVLVISNPATRQLGEAALGVRRRRGGRGARGDGGARLSRRRAAGCARRGDGRLRRRAGSDGPIAFAHRRSQGRERARRSDRDPSRGDRGHARSRDERRHGGIAPQGRALADALTAASEARITCPNGSDLRLGLEGRKAISDAGELSAPGAFGNLPCGEGFIAPVEGTCEGPLVVDGSIAAVGIPDEPVTLTVAAGRLADATGKPARG